MATNHKAEQLANLTFNLLARCQAKEEWLATQRGLFQAEFKCLRLFGCDKYLNCKEISKRMNLSQSRLTRIIDGLVKKGYMNREIDPTDRRNMKVTLSRRGKILTNKIDREFTEIHQEILQHIDVSKHESLIDSMEHFFMATEKWRENS
jgi:DNA-binding MarR family transcriptional regulator